jgi:exopolysaccharide biosynthesis polyprenyl glycosylphosphotransferase
MSLGANETMSVIAISDLPKSAPKLPYSLEPPPGRTGSAGTTTSWNSLGALTADVVLVYLSGLVAYRLRYPDTTFADLGRMFLGNPLSPGSTYFGFLTLYAVLLILVALSQHLYSAGGRGALATEMFLVGRSVIVTVLLLTASLYLSGISSSMSRFVLMMTAVLSFATLTTWRAYRDHRMKKRLAKGIGLRHVLIVGAGRVGRLFASYVEQNPSWGYEVRGFLDTYQTDDPQVLGRIGDLKRIIRQEFIDDVFVTIPSERELVKQIILETHQLGVCTYVLPELYDGYAWLKPVEFVGEFAVRVMYREPIPEPELFLKRVMDIVGSAIGLAVLSPILGLIALAIKLDSDGPVLYRAHRVGRKGRRFVCHKFRTMVTNADDMKDKLRHLNEREGPFFKIERDPRITRVGRFLRKYSLDELPQLWDVLRGEMSLVGPRPHPVDDYQQYTLEHLRRLDVTPGITGLWQIMARKDPSFEKALALDNQYIETWSFLSDMRILLKTIPSLINGAGS